MPEPQPNPLVDLNNARNLPKRGSDRWRELVLKHCLDEITPAEQEKLDRLQALRRSGSRSQGEIVNEARQDWEIKKLVKRLRRAIYEERSSL